MERKRKFRWFKKKLTINYDFSMRRELSGNDLMDCAPYCCTKVSFFSFYVSIDSLCSSSDFLVKTTFSMVSVVLHENRTFKWGPRLLVWEKLSEKLVQDDPQASDEVFKLLASQVSQSSSKFSSRAIGFGGVKTKLNQEVQSEDWYQNCFRI